MATPWKNPLCTRYVNFFVKDTSIYFTGFCNGYHMVSNGFQIWKIDVAARNVQWTLDSTAPFIQNELWLTMPDGMGCAFPTVEEDNMYCVFEFSWESYQYQPWLHFNFPPKDTYYFGGVIYDTIKNTWKASPVATLSDPAPIDIRTNTRNKIVRGTKVINGELTIFVCPSTGCDVWSWKTI